MNSNILQEGNLQFEFTGFTCVERFDDSPINPNGMKSVDFFAEDSEYLYFIEVKDYQNPKAPKHRRIKDFKKLINAGTDENALFCFQMGAKIKDSLLRKYSLGEPFIKNVIYLLFINLDSLGARERGMLYAKINGHVPTGLNDCRYRNFTNISFELVDIERLKQYRIYCTVK